MRIFNWSSIEAIVCSCWHGDETSYSMNGRQETCLLVILIPACVYYCLCCSKQGHASRPHPRKPMMNTT
jgi:hypothetical protein